MGPKPYKRSSSGWFDRLGRLGVGKCVRDGQPQSHAIMRVCFRTCTRTRFLITSIASLGHVEALGVMSAHGFVVRRYKQKIGVHVLAPQTQKL